ncbi:DUF177 domain-containing protein [Gymnodinialimonas hymeniacidonis]|uniref:YceD family protein n=1 Tax=Gymnodinialimonas hymeniacidonis TaxID=3126508 RepID=UPI0034C5CE3C
MPSTTLSLSRLGRAAPTAFEVEPDADARKALADALELRGLRKVRLVGEVTPEGKADWRLEAKLGATVVQDCVVTLEPVTTRIDAPVLRSYRVDLPEPSGEEMEMPEDDTIEPLPASLDLMQLLTEALALAVPDYPRAEGVELGEAVFAAPGVAPMTDEDAKPLAGLAALRDQLAKGKDDSENEG